MIDWIEINLPLAVCPDAMEYPSPPNLNDDPQHLALHAWQKQVQEIHQNRQLRTFVGQGLAKAGVQIEVVDVGGVAERYLIGDGGHWSCEFSPAAVVKRYRVLLTETDLAT